MPDTNRFVEPTPDFDALYTAHRDDVWRYLRRRSASEPEDLTTEVFLVAWRRRAELPAAPLPWLYGKGSFVVVIPHEDEQWVADDGSAIVRMVMREDEATFPTPEDKADYDAAGTARPPLDDSPHALAKITVAGLSAARGARAADRSRRPARQDRRWRSDARRDGRPAARDPAHAAGREGRAVQRCSRRLPGATLDPERHRPARTRRASACSSTTRRGGRSSSSIPRPARCSARGRSASRRSPGATIEDWNLVLVIHRSDTAPTTAR